MWLLNFPEFEALSIAQYPISKELALKSNINIFFKLPDSKASANDIAPISVIKLSFKFNDIKFLKLGDFKTSEIAVVPISVIELLP